MEIHKPKFKICVAGAAETGHCSSDTMEKTLEIGKEIANRNCVCVTGVTSGAPYWAAKGAKEVGGIVIGLSPASNHSTHTKEYHLPTDYHDLIIYTGFEYSGRNLFLTRSSDAIIIVCGRIGTLNEFTIAFEDKKIIGILEGSGGTADQIKDIIAKGNRGPGRVIFNSNPKKLVGDVIKMIEEEYNR